VVADRISQLEEKMREHQELFSQYSHHLTNKPQDNPQIEAMIQQDKNNLCGILHLQAHSPDDPQTRRIL
jgi:hypothetical protein